MNSFSLFRTGVQASHGLASSSARVGLGLRTQQIRTYYGKKIHPKAAFEQAQARAAQQSRVQTRVMSSAPRLGLFMGGSLIAATGLSAFGSQKVHCESARPYASTSTPVVQTSTSSAQPIAEEPQSMVNIYQLSFGTICGVCAGIFIKKGLKLIAVLLGGCYVFLQYMNSQRLISVNWSAINSRYDQFVGSAAGPADSTASGFRGSTAQRIWNRTTNFLMADFQPRATFMAGLVLGLRLG